MSSPCGWKLWVGGVMNLSRKCHVGLVTVFSRYCQQCYSNSSAVLHHSMCPHSMVFHSACLPMYACAARDIEEMFVFMFTECYRRSTYLYGICDKLLITAKSFVKEKFFNHLITCFLNTHTVFIVLGYKWIDFCLFTLGGGCISQRSAEACLFIWFVCFCAMFSIYKQHSGVKWINHSVSTVFDEYSQQYCLLMCCVSVCLIHTVAEAVWFLQSSWKPKCRCDVCNAHCIVI